MVAITITMVMVVAASYLYLASSESRKVQYDQQMVSENGQFAMDMIGRDLLNAGFYPMVWQNLPSPSTGGIQTTTIFRSGFYFNPHNTATRTVAAFDTGIFGCEGMRFDSAIAQLNCVSHANVANTADTLIVNYFTTDAMGSNIGHRLDCVRGNVSGAAENTDRAGTGKTDTVGLQPNAPLFVSNRYTLSSVTYTIEDRTVSTLGLNCTGNTNVALADTRPLIVGIEDLQLRFGVHTDLNTLQPSQFYRADEMAAVAPLVSSGISLSAWNRVVAVEVCIIARGLLGSKLAEADGTVASFTNCSGDTVTPADRDLRRQMRKTFAVRNALTQTIAP